MTKDAVNWTHFWHPLTTYWSFWVYFFNTQLFKQSRILHSVVDPHYIDLEIIIDSCIIRPWPAGWAKSSWSHPACEQLNWFNSSWESCCPNWLWQLQIWQRRKKRHVWYFFNFQSFMFWWVCDWGHQWFHSVQKKKLQVFNCVAIQLGHLERISSRSDCRRRHEDTWTLVTGDDPKATQKCPAKFGDSL